MTTVNTEHLSRGWALIAEGAQYLSMAYASIDPPVPARETGVPESLSPAVASAAVSPPPSGPSFDELPPEGWRGTTTTLTAETPLNMTYTTEPTLKPQVEAGLGKCPVHGKSWTVAPAGVSKRTGKEYDAFFKCDEKDGDEWCKQKPQKIWRDLHPIPGAAAA